MADGGNIDIPKIGKVKKTYVYGAAGIVGVYVAYRWWNSGQTVDEDAVAPEESTGTIGADVGSGSGGYDYNGSAASDSTVGNVISSNSQWSQSVVSYMTDSLGYDGATVGLAIAKYLRGEKLTTAEANIVRTALAVYGQPPTGGPFTVIEGGQSPSPSTLGAPTGLTVKSKDADSVTLSWNAVSGAASYRIYRGGVAQNVGTSVDTTAEIGGLQPAESYTFYVAAADSSGKTGTRSTGLKTVTSELKLTTPTGLVVESTTATTATLKWNKVSGATGYRLYRNGVASNVGGSADTRGVVQGLARNKTYKFHVRAVSPSGALGPSSATKSGKTKK